jgi:hypothetical protein
MDYNIDTSSYLGLIAKESQSEMIVKVINDKRVSVNKFRQMAMIAGANPETFFEIKNGKAEPIMEKELIYNNLQGQYTLKDTFTNLWPAWIRGLVGSSEKHRGGKHKLIMNVDAAAAAADETKALLNKASQNLIKSETKMLANTRLRGTFNVAQDQFLKDQHIFKAAKAANEDSQKKAKDAREYLITRHATAKAANEDSQKKAKDAREYLITRHATAKAAAAADAKSASNKDGKDKDGKDKDKAEYNRNIQIGVAAAFVILCFILRHRRNKSNRIVKLLETPSSFIRDSIEEFGLSNNGYYNGTLADINSNLHHLFKVSDTKNETVDELRYRLFTKWKSSYWASNQLQSSHLIRSNGSIRDTVEEIGNAIQRLQDFNPLRIPSMAFSKVSTYLSRRKSSQKYLRSRSSHRRRSRSKNKKSKKSNR